MQGAAGHGMGKWEVGWGMWEVGCSMREMEWRTWDGVCRMRRVEYSMQVVEQGMWDVRGGLQKGMQMGM